ncbi:MAG TPA: type II secretion system F family protein [Syntrophales bacterium]|nr:type II secretion system F family protein [Syntrophales bacterium]
MPVYSYRGTTREGVIVEGAIEAADENMALERLKSTGVIPLRVAAPSAKSRWSPRLRSSRADLIAFTTELSALLGAKLPLDRSLNILADVAESEELRKVTISVLRSIREGNSFADALQRHSRMFPRLYINVVRAGESAGAVDIVLSELSEFLESTQELRDHVVSAMIYPTILVVTGGLSIILLLTFVLPRFASIFKEMGTAIPLPTQIVLVTSSFLQGWWWVLLLVLIGGAAAFQNYRRSPEGQLRWDAFKLKLMQDVIRKLETARFCRTLGILLRSGVPLLQALNNARDVIGNRVIARSVDSIMAGVKEGKGISAPLSSSGAFPPLALSMITVGEETGHLEEMLLKVASTYERSLKQSVKRFIGILEPAMILFMGLIIGFIVVSMLMAIFSITDIPF